MQTLFFLIEIILLILIWLDGRRMLQSSLNQEAMYKEYFDELKKHFSEPEIVDIHMLAGLANLTNRLTDPLGLELEFPEEKV